MDYNGLFRSLFDHAETENFKLGYASWFSDMLIAGISHGQVDAINALQSVLVDDGFNVDNRAYAIQMIAHIDNMTRDIHLYFAFLQMIESGLKSKRAMIRDCACTALSVIESASSIPAIERAIANEPIDSLKQDMQHVLDELKTYV